MEALSIEKGLKTIRDISESIAIPLIIVSLWVYIGGPLTNMTYGIPVIALFICCLLGLAFFIITYQLISFVASRTPYLPILPVISTSLVSAGIIYFFQNYLPIQLFEANQFSGAALIAYGFCLEVVDERVKANKNKLSEDKFKKSS